MLRTFGRIGLKHEGRLWSRAYVAVAQSKAVEVNDSDWNNARPFDEVPGPTLLGLVRSMMIPGGKYYNASMQQLNEMFKRDFGNLMRMPGMLGRKEILMTFEPADFELIFRNEGTWPRREGAEIFDYYRSVHRADIYKGGGLVTSQGEPWQEMRTIVNPVMMQPKTVKLYVPRVDEIAQDFIKVMKSKLDEKGELPADFGNEMNRYALESIGCIALDTRLGVLDSRTATDESKIMFEHLHVLFDQMYKLDILQSSMWKYFKTAGFHTTMKSFDIITDIIMKYVDKAIDRLEKSGAKNEQEMGVLEKLLKVDRHYAIVMASDMLLVGVDTTSSMTLSTILELAKAPEKQKKLREELRAVMPRKDSPLTTEKMQNMPYLRACIKEVLRVKPVTSGTLRQTQADLVLQGYRIPKGTSIVAASSILHMDPNRFTKAKEFIPERWLRNEQTAECPNAKEAHPFIYLPFGFGPRMCVGRRFAEMEVEVLTARLFRQFEVEWHYGEVPYKSTLLNYPEGDLKFRLKEVKD